VICIFDDNGHRVSYTYKERDFFIRTEIKSTNLTACNIRLVTLQFKYACFRNRKQLRRNRRRRGARRARDFVVGDFLAD
jgi:hypothetical protein